MLGENKINQFKYKKKQNKNWTISVGSKKEKGAGHKNKIEQKENGWVGWVVFKMLGIEFNYPYFYLLGRFRDFPVSKWIINIACNIHYRSTLYKDQHCVIFDI